jgi:putative membrane protein
MSHDHGGGQHGPPLSGLLGWDALFSWDFGLAGIVALVLALGYMGAMCLLRARGVVWPTGRLLCWMGGVTTAAAVVSGGMGMLGGQLLSVHMAQHMVLSMLAPILLLLAAPVTLVLRALPVGRGVSGSPRRALMAVLHGRIAAVVSHPGFTVPLFVGSLYGLYFTPLLDVAMSSHAGHVLMLAHFLLVGLVFFGPILAVDPWPHRASPGMRLLWLLPTVPFHAFFGVALMQAQQPVSTTFATGTAALGMNPLQDQVLAGGIAWGFGEIPILVVVAVVFVQWRRADARMAARLDRQADRDGERERAAYNAMLADLHQRAASSRTSSTWPSGQAPTHLVSASAPEAADPQTRRTGCAGAHVLSPGPNSATGSGLQRDSHCPTKAFVGSELTTSCA